MADYNNGGYQPQGQQPMYNPPQYQPQAGIDPPPGYIQRSRIAAGILAMLLGAYGIHSFYLGNTSRGLVPPSRRRLTSSRAKSTVSRTPPTLTASSSWTAASTLTPTASS